MRLWALSADDLGAMEVFVFDWMFDRWMDESMKLIIIYSLSELNELMNMTNGALGQLCAHMR